MTKEFTISFYRKISTLIFIMEVKRALKFLNKKELEKLSKTNHNLNEMSKIGDPSLEGKHFKFL